MNKLAQHKARYITARNRYEKFSDDRWRRATAIAKEEVFIDECQLEIAEFVPINRKRNPMTQTLDEVFESIMKEKQYWREIKHRLKIGLITLAFIAALVWVSCSLSGCQALRGLANDTGDFCHYIETNIPAHDYTERN